MFFLPFWTLITWLVLGGFELAPTLITYVDWMMCFLCTHLTYRVLQELPRKRETSDWLKARFKLLCFLTPILHYFHLLGLPLEQIVMIDWLGMLRMLADLLVPLLQREIAAKPGTLAPDKIAILQLF